MRGFSTGNLFDGDMDMKKSLGTGTRWRYGLGAPLPPQAFPFLLHAINRSWRYHGESVCAYKKHSSSKAHIINKVLSIIWSQSFADLMRSQLTLQNLRVGAFFIRSCRGVGKGSRMEWLAMTQCWSWHYLLKKAADQVEMSNKKILQ